MNIFNPREATIIHEEIADLESLLRGLPEIESNIDPFYAYKERLGLLNDELYYANLLEKVKKTRAEIIDLRIDRKVKKINALPASFVGSFLNKWQDLFSSLGQVLSGFPTTRGKIPQDILDQTALYIMPFSVGSFAIRCAIPTLPIGEVLEGVNLGERLFGFFSNIVDSGSDEDALVSIFSETKHRFFNNYKSLIHLLANNNLNVSVGFVSSCQKELVRNIKLRDEYIASVAESFHTVERRLKILEKSESIYGKLIAANIDSGYFKIEDEGGSVYAGKANDEAKEILNGINLGYNYNFQLITKEVVNEKTGDRSFEYSLIGISVK